MDFVKELVVGCLGVAVGIVVVMRVFNTFTRPLPAFFQNLNNKTALVIEVLLGTVTVLVLQELAAQYAFQENLLLRKLTEGLGFGVVMGLVGGLEGHRRAHKREADNSSSSSAE
jgi:hypothetical protein